jgi:peptidoglycan/LPS O-acetylase OafA/YrhL
VRDRLPALDGLRAVAVAAVLAFHGGVPGVGGGLLGVDLFLVVSGFLITSLLLAERDRRGTISLAGFWARRARRLLPALLITLSAVAVASRWIQIVPAAQLRGDLLAALYYGSNWHYVAAGQSYFGAFGAESPLLHLWSLAVEEQFYVVWPLVAVVVLRWWGRRGLGSLAAVGVAASAGWTAWLFRDGAGISRLYYGTDTRAQALLIGCLLACLIIRRPVTTERHRAGLGWAGVAGGGYLIWAFHAVTGTDGFLYQGGFLLVAVAGAAVIAAVTAPASGPAAVMVRLLSPAPLRYLGRISYGLYLYHWPLFLVLDQARTGLSGTGLLGLRLACTLACAVVSFHLVEEPVRTGSWRTGWARWRQVTVGSMAAVLACGGGLAVTTSVAAAVSVSVVGPHPAPALAVPTTAPPGPTVRDLLVGDSLAVTLAPGLSEDSSAWGVSVDDEAALGCDLDPATTVNTNGSPGPAGQGCPDWPRKWKALVDRLDPDVVAVELGRFETADRLYDGRWTSAGQPGFDAHLQAEMVRAIDVLSSGGAKVALLTLPYVAQTTAQPDGSPWPINDPSRTRAWNSVLQRAAAERPGAATVVDLNALLDPGGRYADYVDGVGVRAVDREHFSQAGGMLARSLVLPVLAQLGHSRAEVGSGG